MLRYVMVLMLGLASVASAADRPPNIIIIYADDLGYGDVGFNGRKEWSTPNLDRLGKQGTIFRRWYTAGVVCAPSRTALLTGRYGIHNGVTGNGSLDTPSEEVTLAEILKPHGYATALFGKWHHGGPRPGKKEYTHPMDQGFDEFFGFTNAVHAWEKFPKEIWVGREKKPTDGDYCDAMFTDRAIEFLGRHKDKPFFLYVPYTAPHGIVDAPKENIAEHTPKFKEADPSKPVNAAYAAMITRMDKEVGRLMAALEEQKLAENTLVIFSSDHGATFEKAMHGSTNYHDSNQPFRGQKRTLWEGGVRVPGIVRWPGKVPAGGESHELVHMIDVVPSVLAATGVRAPEERPIDGKNLLPVWQGKEKSPDRTVFWEWREGGDTQLAAMRGDMKLVISGSNTPELYNVKADPAERRQIEADHPKLAKQLEEELHAWLATESEAAKQRRTPKKAAAGL
jgi:arylsulfatase A-like enzyme